MPGLQHRGHKRAVVAVARKLAIILHRMWMRAGADDGGTRRILTRKLSHHSRYHHFIDRIIHTISMLFAQSGAQSCPRSGAVALQRAVRGLGRCRQAPHARRANPVRRRHLGPAAGSGRGGNGGSFTGFGRYRMKTLAGIRRGEVRWGLTTPAGRWPGCDAPNPRPSAGSGIRERHR